MSRRKQLFVAERVKEPTTIKQAMKDPNWVSAMEKEHETLMRNKTWDLVDQPANVNIIGYKWVFKIKYKADGSIERHKA